MNETTAIAVREHFPLADIRTMAQTVVESGLFGIKNPTQIMTLMLLAQSEGIHPIQALRRYHVIEGKPAMKADAMLAEFQLRGGTVEWIERTAESVKAKFSHKSGGNATIQWTFEEAKAAGLTGKDNWKKYPRQMLSARVISEGVRAVFPAVNCGIYAEEEVRDFVDVTPLPVDAMASHDEYIVPEKYDGAKSDPLKVEEDPKVDPDKFVASIEKFGWTEEQAIKLASEKFGPDWGVTMFTADLTRSQGKELHTHCKINPKDTTNE